jgi:hypothetical protein
MVLVLFMPPAYGKASKKAETVYRVSVSVNTNLGQAESNLAARKTPDAAELAGDMKKARDAVRKDPRKGLKVVLEFARTTAKAAEKEKARAAAVREMEKHPALRDLARAIAEKGHLGASMKKAGHAASGAGGEAARKELKAALAAVREALIGDRALREMLERLLEDIEKKDATAFEKDLKRLTEKLSKKRDLAALEAAEARFSAEAKALADALGESVLLGGRGKPGAKSADTVAETAELSLADSYESIGAMIQKERIPARFHETVRRYFTRTQQNPIK